MIGVCGPVCTPYIVNAVGGSVCTDTCISFEGMGVSHT